MWRERNLANNSKEVKEWEYGCFQYQQLILIELMTVMNFDQGKSMVEVYPSVSLGISLGKASHPSILAWRIQSMGTQRVRHDWASFTHLENIFKRSQYFERSYFQGCASYVSLWKRICLPMQQTQGIWLHPCVGKISWSRKWQPAPVFLPGKLHGQRSLTRYSPWGCKELDVTEHARTSGAISALVKKSVVFSVFKALFLTLISIPEYKYLSVWQGQFHN